MTDLFDMPGTAEPVEVTAPAGIDFFAVCVPPTANHQRKKIVKVGRFSRLADHDSLNAAKDAIDAVLQPHQPKEPVRGAVRLILEFTWPFPKSTPKRDVAKGRIPKTTKPDCSNAAKTLEDRLVALCFIEDDAAVAELVVRKFFGASPGIRVAIAPMEVA